jgi:hypothetical protein
MPDLTTEAEAQAYQAGYDEGYNAATRDALASMERLLPPAIQEVIDLVIAEERR